MKRQRLAKSAALGLVFLAGSAHADAIYGIYADIDYWHSSVSGSQASNQHSYNNKGQMMAAVSLEHPVPLIPNVRLRHTSLNADGKQPVTHTLNASSTDAIAYYEILDNVVSLDLGLGAKRISGDIKHGNVKQYALDDTLGMAYASVGGKLPLTGLSAKAELAIAKGKNSSATDAQAELKYDFVDKAWVDIGAKVGYRALNLDYNKAATPTGATVPYQVDFQGPYVGLELHF